MSSAPAVSSSPAGTHSTPSRPAANDDDERQPDHALSGSCSTTSADGADRQPDARDRQRAAAVGGPPRRRAR